MMRVLIAVIGFYFFFVSIPVLPGERPVVAVFDMEDRGSGVSPEVLEKLTDQLVVLMAGGGYHVIPRDEIKERQGAVMTESYKLCYDQKCQIELGRELAAEKTIATQVSKFADLCTLSVIVYDLKKAATDAAATGRGSCDEKGLLDSLDRAVKKLVGTSHAQATIAKKKVHGMAKEPPPKVDTPERHYLDKKVPSVIEWVQSQPAGVKFSRSEITVAQYRKCVEAGFCTVPLSGSSCNWGVDNRKDHPVNCVDWHQANSFCSWASGRLPTEKEWKAEASNKGTRVYPWGNQEVTCDFSIWGDGKRTDGCGDNSSWPVCSKRAGSSVSGLCDMSGNVSEWMSSSVLLGGSWRDGLRKAVSASFKMRFSQTDRRSTVGFRCARGGKR